MSTIYNDKTYLDNNPNWHEEDAPFKANKIMELLNKNNISFKTINEVGCGSGEILVQLSNHYEDVIFYGFDISKDAIEIAKKKETDHIKFELKNISEVVIPTRFDLQLIMDVIEHVEDYFQFLEDISTKSKYTIFHIPLDMCMWTLFREQKLIDAKNRIGHIHNFTEEFVLSILKDKGFQVIDKLYTEPIFEKSSFKQSIINSMRKITALISKRLASKTYGGYSIMVLTKNKN